MKPFLLTAALFCFSVNHAQAEGILSISCDISGEMDGQKVREIMQSREEVRDGDASTAVLAQTTIGRFTIRASTLHIPSPPQLYGDLNIFTTDNERVAHTGGSDGFLTLYFRDGADFLWVFCDSRTAGR